MFHESLLMLRMNCWAFSLVVIMGCTIPAERGPEFIGLHGTRFTLEGKRFVPWGFNYDHDENNRLLEYYWYEEWKKVEEDFVEMRQLGANTVRVHLQVSRFMVSEKEVNRDSLRRLVRLLRLAERTGIYLNITGLGCYDKPDVPHWYNELNEERRWEVQARFWEAIAKTCRNSRMVFCYDLMNEPVVKEGPEWTPGAFGDRYFVQSLTLDLAGRTQHEVARQWVERMVSAVRKYDTRHLITVGEIPWSMVWPGVKPFFHAPGVGEKLDFVSVHFYPKKGEVQKALEALSVYDIGKPVVIEEMFPLECSIEELDAFIDGSQKIATGWFGFYWGKTLEEYRQSQKDIVEALMINWLEYFKSKRNTE